VAENSSIEWTDDTWTPIRARVIEITDDGAGRERIGWHCEHASPGCKNCYSEGINRRLGTGRDFKPAQLRHQLANGDQRGDVTVFLDEKMLLAPLRRKGARMVFPCSMTDLFGRFVEERWIDKMFAVMALSPRHTYQVLTKRADRMAEYLTAPGVRGRVIGEAWNLLGLLPKYEHGGILERLWPLPNVWAGVSVEDQERGDERRPHAERLAIAGWTTWVSYEPALGPVDWAGWEFLHWMVSGGESGPKARPTHPNWHRATRDWCATHRVAYLFKQWGEWNPGNVHEAVAAKTSVRVERTGAVHPWPPAFDLASGDWCMHKVGKKAAGRLLDGVTHDGFPEVKP
jgi:protein gp37